MERPELLNGLSSEEFKDHYYLKSELMEFCRANGLKVTGGKPELTDRVAYFLDTGKELPSTTKIKTRPPAVITLDTIIEENPRCSEKHRQFFKEQIGEKFKFNVEFMDWLRENSGKRYSDAVEEYPRTLLNKKNRNTNIAKQFEYNTYIRDFFQNNENMTLADAIVCWKYKKSISGHNKYESSDKVALEKPDDEKTN